MRIQCKVISTENISDILSHYFDHLIGVLTTHHHASYITAHESAELAAAYSNAQCMNSVIGKYMYNDRDIVNHDQEFVYHPIGIYYIADLNDTYFIWANYPMLRNRLQPTKLQDYRYITFDQLRDLENL